MTRGDGRPAAECDPVPDAGPQGGGYRRLIANRGFRRLWLSQFVSGVGDWLVISLLMYLVLQISGGSSFAVAGIMVAKIVPALFLSSLIGVLVDRFDRRRVMIVADVARAILALSFFTRSLALIYVALMLMEVASLFFVPAKNALIPHLVADEDVESANGLSYTTQQASMLIGLTMSGAIVATFDAVVRAVLRAELPLVHQLVGPFAPQLLGPRAGIVLDSLTFVVSAIAIAGIRPPACERVGAGERLDLRLLGKDLRESLSFVREHPELRQFLTTIGLAILGGGSIIALAQPYVVYRLKGTLPLVERVPVLQRLVGAPATFIMVFLAFGMVAGALIVPRLSRRLRLQLLFVGGVAGFGLSMGAFASVDRYTLRALFAVGAGFAVAVVSVAGTSYVVRTVRDTIRGRVFTTLESVIRVSLLISMLVFPPMGDLIAALMRRVFEGQSLLAGHLAFTGPRIALQLASLVVIGAAVYGYRKLEWRGGAPHGAADHAEPGRPPGHDLPEEEAAHV